MQLQNQDCLDWLCVDLKNTAKAKKLTNWSRYWGIYEKRFGSSKENSADTYQKILQYSLLLWDNEVIVLKVLENYVKHLYFKRNILKNVLPNTF